VDHANPESGQNNRNFLTFMGFEVVLTQVMPQTSATQAGKVMILFGDMTLAAMIGDRRTINLRRSNQRYFDSDQIGWLGTERVDIVVHDVGDNTTAGPLVGLVGG
jgi:HK97 family phage major capsid protein